MAAELKNVDVVVDAVQLGKLFNCTREHISRLHKVHGMPKSSRGRFNLVECVQWYIDYKHNSKRVGSEERDLKNKLITAQQLRVDIENKTKLGELLPVNDVTAKFNAMMSVVASQLDALGPRCAPRVASMSSVAECQKVIFDETRSVRRAAATEIEALANFDDGGGNTETPAKPTRRRMGRRQSRVAAG